MGKIIESCMAKAIKTDSEDFKRSSKWALARRGSLIVKEDELQMNQWVFPYSEIDEVVLFKTKTLFFITCYILMIKFKGDIYQFGLNPNKFWEGELPFPVKRQEGKTGYSPFSILTRVVAVILILAAIYMDYIK